MERAHTGLLQGGGARLSGNSEIAYLYRAFLRDKDVLWFDVSVEDSHAVNVLHASETAHHNRFYHALRNYGRMTAEIRQQVP